MRKIIILERVNEPSDFTFRVVYWPSVPAGREILYADPNKTSIVKDATVDELNDIKEGRVVEFSNIPFFKEGVALVDVKAALEKHFSVFQAEIEVRNPGKFYGTFYDGTKWIDGGLQ